MVQREIVPVHCGLHKRFMRRPLVQQSRRGEAEVMAHDEVVRVGSRVRVRDVDGEAVFAVVPPEEADAAAERVSAESPLGRALLGRRCGEQVRFRAPAGVLAVTVVEVSA